MEVSNHKNSYETPYELINEGAYKRDKEEAKRLREERKAEREAQREGEREVEREAAKTTRGVTSETDVKADNVSETNNLVATNGETALGTIEKRAPINELVALNGVDIEVLEYQDTWAVSNKQVAAAFGVSEGAIRWQKTQSASEFVEGKHFYLLENQTGNAMQTFWTKKGVITLGFRLRETPRTIAFRDWASDYILKKSDERSLQLVELALNRAIEQARENERLKAEIAALDERVKRLEAGFDNSGYISPFEQRQLREAVQRRVKALRDSLRERGGKEAADSRFTYSAVWKKIGERFGLLHYGYLRSSELDKALAFINAIEV